VKVKIIQGGSKMNLIKYRPDRFLDIFDDSWGSIVDSFFNGIPRMEKSVPAVDIQEDDKGYTMEVELPGLTDKDIEVKVEGNMLTLSSKKDEQKEEKNKGYVMKERRSYSFSRSFVLPKNTDADKISAEFKNGLLTVNVPKPEEAKPKLLEIKVK
jgi:HSP20 family protein